MICEIERRVPGRSGILGRRGPRCRRASSALAAAAILPRPVPGHLEYYFNCWFCVSHYDICCRRRRGAGEGVLTGMVGSVGAVGRRLGRLLEVCLFRGRGNERKIED
jgi:hypothetical protein